MRIEIRSDSVIIDGYVNAVGRDSNPVNTKKHGKVVEQIEPRAFQRAIDRAPKVDLLLNHNKKRNLGGTEEGNLELFEDNIGLRAIAEVKDPEVIQKAREKKLKGWSFAMVGAKDDIEERGEGKLPRRIVKDLDIKEVSIIADPYTPVYPGTSIETRAEEEEPEERAEEYERTVTIEEPIKMDHSSLKIRLNRLKKSV